MRRLLLLTASACAFLSLGSAAHAATFIVNTTEDTSDTVCDAGHCTLREAIEVANASPGSDEIVFSIAGTAPHRITVASSTLGDLPAIAEPVQILAVSFDGAGLPTAPPPIEVVSDQASSGFVGGVGVHFFGGASGSRVSGLAIGGFSWGVYSESGGVNISGNHLGVNAAGDTAIGNHYGVHTAGGDVVRGNLISGNASAGVYMNGNASQLTRNRIGTNLAGTQALPNNLGVQVVTGSDNRVGDAALGGNQISGNTFEGVSVHNDTGGTVIEGNGIGTSATGGALGNGRLGVYVDSTAAGLTIGGAGSAANEIAFNGSGGVQMPFFSTASSVRITRNSIHSNDETGGFGIGLGIDIGQDGVTENDEDDADPWHQNFPVISSAERLGDETRISGTLHSEGGRIYELEFFGNAACDPSGHGEGRTFLGRESVTTNGAGDASFTVTVPRRLGEGDVVTSTAHRVGVSGANTSEFSACSASAVPPPALGTRVTVAPVSGVVRVRRPGGGFRTLKAGQSIPVGSTVDTRRGVVRLTSAANRRGKTQTANFDDGVFKTAQKREAKAFTELKLTGPLQGCKANQSASSSARRRRGRRLWGSGSGRFRSIGNRASAGVRGTKWLVEDRCDGSTLVAVKEGRVTVRDFVRSKTITLRAGNRYVAGPRPR